ncbi:MAG: CrcB family protein [Succinivibrio sp.]|jgi:CrcB protein|nr:CrcB family protein [Succinivibrio sp.]
MLTNLLLAATGGALGAVSRVLLSLALDGASLALRFPAGTLAVNAIGCYLIGLALNLPILSSPQLRVLLTAGFLGGFTTFSTFTNDSLSLLLRGEALRFCLNLALNLGLGLLLCALGIITARALAR